jgi:hypothetical protein
MFLEAATTTKALVNRVQVPSRSLEKVNLPSALYRSVPTKQACAVPGVAIPCWP